MSRPVLTSSQLAARLGRSLGWVEALLQESERDGVLERVGEHGWRLTEDADQKYGSVLRAFAEDGA